MVILWLAFVCYWLSWKVALYIFPPHKSSLPKYHSTYQSAGGVFSLTLSSNFAGLLCVCSMVYLLSVWDRVHGCDIYNSLSQIGPWVLFIVRLQQHIVRLISKWPCVSGDLQHQASVTQTSLWFLYMYFVLDFLHLFFPGWMPCR